MHRQGLQMYNGTLSPDISTATNYNKNYFTVIPYSLKFWGVKFLWFVVDKIFVGA